MKKRLDLLMVERALAPSREKAKAYIMSGDVYVDGQKEDKAGTMFKETVKIEVRGNTLPYVSRGGLKLEKAMNNFGDEVIFSNKYCLIEFFFSSLNFMFITSFRVLFYYNMLILSILF